VAIQEFKLKQNKFKLTETKYFVKKSPV